MKVMVVGSGGREHALAWKLSQDNDVESIVSCPGNPGIAELGLCLPVDPCDATGLLRAIEEHSVDFVVFGPEDPLVRGTGELVAAEGVTVFGPSRAAARLEGSKVFAKLFMRRHGIPTAAFEIFDSYEKAISHVRSRNCRLIVKADGLARGKGVAVCSNAMEAESALKDAMVHRKFGDAGNRVIVEECVDGEEISVMAICDGSHYLLLPCSQDHKRAFDNDVGPNTGGMGAYCPVPWVDENLLNVIETSIVRPTIEGMAKEESCYRGVLYAGLMLTSRGPVTLEFNCRFGDPEAQAIFPATKVDLGKTLFAAAQGRLSRTERLGAFRNCVCVVACSGGYPGDYTTGKEIAGLERLADAEGVLVFHAGTKREGARLLTAGGRVLGVVGVMPTPSEAISRAYEAIKSISFEGIRSRGDIGSGGLRK